MTIDDKERALTLTLAAVELRPGRTPAEVLHDLASVGVPEAAGRSAIMSGFDAGTIGRDRKLRLIPGPGHKPDPAAAAELADLLISGLSAERQRLGERIRELAARRDEFRIRADEHRFEDFAWLAANPNHPGQHDAMRAWVNAQFGGEYAGVIASGYHQLEDGAQQQSFQLRAYAGDPEERAAHLSNVRRFLTENAPLLRPNADLEGRPVVSFLVNAEESGLSSVALDPVSGEFFSFRTVYRRNSHISDPMTLERVIAHIDQITRPEPEESGCEPF